jgi:NADH-quinone oxidoreductase subunit N
MIDVDYFKVLVALLPEFLVLLAGLGAVGAGIAADKKGHERSPWPEGIALVGLAAAGVVVVMMPMDVRMFGDMLVLDPLSRLLKLLLLALTVGTVVLARDRGAMGNHGEYLGILLLATIGLMLAVSTEELLLIFLSLELASLSFYILVAFKRSTAESAEAALKYFLFGGVSAAFLLFGISLLYGFAGATSLREISEVIGRGEPEPFAVAGIAMVLAGLGFKIAAAPFHPWAPDVYQAAPSSSAAIIASSSKLASFLVAIKVTLIGLAGWEGSAAWGGFMPGWIPMIALMAAVSLVIGSFTALAQKSVRRLVAYSAIAHAGYVLVGLAAANPEGVTAVLFYSVQYAVTAVGIFAIIGLVERARGGDEFRHFGGLLKRDPLIGTCLIIFVVSLAGIPPLAGFFGKFYLFSSALELGAGGTAPGLLWLVALAAAMSVVSIYYYLTVLKHSFKEEPAPVVVVESGREVLAPRMLTALLAGIVVLLGVLPGVLVAPLEQAVAVLLGG